ncbi:unnamed protein product, partial [Chrysoparadoxa australica]
MVSLEDALVRIHKSMEKLELEHGLLVSHTNHAVFGQGSSQARSGPTWACLALAVLGLIITGRCMMRVKKAGSEKPRDNALQEPYWACKGQPCDVAFVGHPTTVLSLMSHWLPPHNPSECWTSSWWMIPLWPLCFVISLLNMYVSPRMRGPYNVVDRFTYSQVENQVWLSRAFGYQFMLGFWRRRIESNIEDIAKAADRSGVKVVGLGALNKAEFINGGGDRIVNNVSFSSSCCVVNGSTLT